jgi:hypothetical protein
MVEFNGAGRLNGAHQAKPNQNQSTDGFKSDKNFLDELNSVLEVINEFEDAAVNDEQALQKLSETKHADNLRKIVSESQEVQHGWQIFNQNGL